MAELELDDILRRFCGAISEISGVIVTDRKGDLIAASLPSYRSVILYSKLITLLYLENERLGKICFGESEFDWFQICFGNEYFISKSAGKNCLLTVYCNRDVRLGRINLDMKRTAEKIAQLERLPSGLKIKWSEIQSYREELEKEIKKEDLLEIEKLKQFKKKREEIKKREEEREREGQKEIELEIEWETLLKKRREEYKKRKEEREIERQKKRKKEKKRSKQLEKIQEEEWEQKERKIHKEWGKENFMELRRLRKIMTEPSLELGIQRKPTDENYNIYLKLKDLLERKYNSGELYDGSYQRMLKKINAKLHKFRKDQRN